jgi:hypothetical protein
MLLSRAIFSSSRYAHSLDEPDAIGRTRFERRVDAHAATLAPLLAIDVHWWLQDETFKAVEVEETVPCDTSEAAAGIATNRYLHAIRHIKRHRWIHVDGAVKAYDQASYKPSRDLPNAEKGPPVAYHKLWHADRDICDATWGRLLGHHFRGNELVIEAFGSMLDERPGATAADIAKAARLLGLVEK